MGKRGFIAYDPILAREKFASDIVITIYYTKLLRYDEILSKDSEGFFTRSNRQIEVSTCITSKQQRRACQWLEDHSYIVVELRTPVGKASKQLHFKIIDRKLSK